MPRLVIRKQGAIVAFIVLQSAIYANGASFVHGLQCFSFRSNFLLMNINHIDTER